MAERVLFNIAEEIVKKLGPLATQEIALWWGVKDQLSKLMSTVTRIKGVLHDAEEQVQKPPAQLEDWLGKLQEAVYDAEDLLDDFSTEVQRKRLRSRNKIPREVRTFFSGSNQLVYGWQMGHKVKELRQRLDEIVSESEKFHFEVRYEENASLTMIREATTSSEPEIFFGREDEKKKVMSFLLNPNDEIDGRDGEKWDCLRQSLPHEEARGNKMIITTRSDAIAKLTSRLSLALKGLSEKESWSLFSNKAFGSGQESNYIDEKIKKEIVERCQGVPLVIKAIARLMSLKDRAQWLPFIKQELPHRSIKVEGGGNRICDLTRHVSFDTEFDLSLPCAKRLRTLVLLQGGKWDEGAWESICRDFRRLRVLVLSDFGMKEVSPLIEKIKHLKYLDLSNNEIEALSNSVTSLVNLQVLKLNGCRKLKELPRDISKLINLRHLDVGCTLDDDLCEDLEYMPRGIGKLTSLQTLSCFVVAKKSSSKSEIIGGLDELRRLNELRGRLEIIVKGCDGGSCLSEFEGAKLIDKEYLQSLTVWWDPKLDSDSDIDLYDKMLQSLRPNSNLQGLIVGVYGGMRFPSWVSHLSNLASIVLVDCGRLKHIPPLDGIPSLEELRIVRLGDLEYIDSEGVGGKGASMFFPSLKTLDIEDCFRLKGWRKRWSRDEMNDDSDESTIEEGLIMLSFPRLSSLSIDECPNLTSMPLFPTLDEDLNLWRTSSMPLQQTMKMTSPVSSSSFIRPLSKLKRLDMLFIDDMESLPEVGLQNLSSLQSLSIRGCSRLKSLPLPDKGMHSLQKLEVVGCRELKSLSESQEMIPYLPSLQALSIEDCSEELSGRGKER
uniref:NBS-LRR resistance protein RGH2 n=1 Tax=Populus alba TaxID=43335 RepID=A0A4U5QXG1_POPAL|nr:NBS-LRR resistance protein RGH2 [Populus alba]